MDRSQKFIKLKKRGKCIFCNTKIPKDHNVCTECQETEYL